MAKDYITRLKEQRKLDALESTIEDAFLSPVKAVVYTMPERSEIGIVITDRNFRYMGAYRATDFECRPFDKKALPYEFKDLPLSTMSCDSHEVRRVYLRFMKRTFESYADDYRAQLNKQADLDLGLAVK